MGALAFAAGRGDKGVRRTGEEGGILVLYAMLLGFFLSIGAITVDVGYWWVAGKRAQIAADACALAAAHELPHTYDIDNCAIAPGHDYVLANVPDQSKPHPEPLLLSTSVRSPYGGDASMVEATVQMRVRTFFGKVLGVHWLDITRRAVAERQDGAAKLAIFSASADCSKSFLVNGKNINVTGHIHSNGQYQVNSAPKPDHFWATSGAIARENCVSKLNPDGPPSGTVETAGAEYGPGPEWLPWDGPELQWPEWFYPADFGWYDPVGVGPGRCTFKAEHIQIDATHLSVSGLPDIPLLPVPGKPGWTLIPPGTYCATGSFKISGDNHAGTITALSPLIQVDGNGQDYKPYAFNMLFFTVPNSNTDSADDDPFTLGNFNPPHLPPYEPCVPSPAVDLNLDGINYTWAGILFNPCGRVKINNHDSSAGTPDLVGTIYGFEVELNGDGFNMVGTEDFDPGKAIALVE
jgi:hypothetical protein